MERGYSGCIEVQEKGGRASSRDPGVQFRCVHCCKKAVLVRQGEVPNVVQVSC